MAEDEVDLMAQTIDPATVVPEGPPAKKNRRGNIKRDFWDKLTPEEKQAHIDKMRNGQKERMRNKKLMKEQMKTLLSLPVQNAKAVKQLKALGLDMDDIDNQMLMIVVMWQQVLKGRANCVPAFNSILNVLGEAANNMDLNANLNMTFNNDLPEKDEPLKDVTPKPEEIEADVDNEPE